MFTEKKVFSLLSKKFNCTQNQLNELSSILSTMFFKPLLTSLNMQIIIPELIPIQCQFQKSWFGEGQKIQEYYFVSEGTFNLYRNFKSQKQQLCYFRNAPSIVGQYFTHNNSNRVYTAVCSDRNGAKGFKISIENFNRLFQNLINQYKSLKSYICSLIGIHSKVLNKIQLYNHCRYQKFMYNSILVPQKCIYIIIDGQCLMSNKKSIQFHSFPKMNLLFKYQLVPLLKLCQNDCVNLDAYYNNSFTYSYQVTSESITFLVIPFEYIKLYPPQLEAHLRSLHQTHQRKAQQFTTYENQKLKQNKIKLQKSLLSITIQSPLSKKQQLLNKSQLSEIRKDYCLSYNQQDHIELWRKKDEVKIPNIFKRQPMIKQKQNMLKKRQWKQYIKLPPLFNDINILNKKIKINPIKESF